MASLSETAVFEDSMMIVSEAADHKFLERRVEQLELENSIIIENIKQLGKWVESIEELLLAVEGSSLATSMLLAKHLGVDLGIDDD